MATFYVDVINDNLKKWVTSNTMYIHLKLFGENVGKD